MTTRLGLLALGIALLGADDALAGKPPAALKVVVPDAPEGLCPGAEARVELVTVDANGRETRVKVTPRSGIELGWEFGEVGPKGEVKMTRDPLATWGKEGRLAAEYLGLEATASLPVRYDCPLVIDLSGQAGAIGEPGADGPPAAAQGVDGEPGHPGGAGEDGPNVEVRLVQVTEPRTGAPVVQVALTASNRQGTGLAAFALDSGHLTVIARGGPGGPGGRGGAGGPGEDVSGSGGDGGPGGRGGPGGTVTLVVDPSLGSARLLGGAIEVDNSGGPGGTPGNGGVIGASAGKGGSSVNSATSGRPGPTGLSGAAGPAVEVVAGTVGPLW